jgi:6-phosphogluconolactonase
MNVTRRGLLTLGGAAAVVTAAGVSTTAQAYEALAPALLGTYDDGIVPATRNPETGELAAETSTRAITAPSWLAYGPERVTLYAISEQDAGTVSALGPDLAVRNTVPTGNGPAHVAVHPGGGFLFTSLYGGGATVTHPINPDGTVGPATDTRRQGSGSHAHQVVVDPTGAWVLAVDLGMDAVFTYTLDAAAGKLTPAGRAGMTPGSGPRHLAFHPGGASAYLANENNSTVTVCAWADGVLTPGQVIAAAPDTGIENYPGEIAVSPDGRFVYVSNRGTNTVGVFAVEPGGSELRRIAAPSCGGDWPRHLAVDPTGNFLYVANQRSGDVCWFPIDSSTGLPGALLGRIPAPGAAQVLL